jgi:hypothetical protein
VRAFVRVAAVAVVTMDGLIHLLGAATFPDDTRWADAMNTRTRGRREAPARHRQVFHCTALATQPRPSREATERLPGDDIIPEATWQLDREIVIAAPPADVWPWLVQMGHGRAGFYTYRTIEDAPGALRRLIGRAPPTVRRILPDCQHLEPGDRIPDAPGDRITWTVEIVDPPDALALSTARRLLTQQMVDPADPPNATWYEASWAFVLRPLDGHSTRLTVRWRSRHTFRYPGLERVTLAVLGFVDAVMHRKQLGTIKQLAEGGS